MIPEVLNTYQHSIGLIKHEAVDRHKVDSTHLDEVNESSGGGN